eukprot:m.378151 g.378151  ORF g.378151 m.378151 type:complete len:80 (-) comp20025_c1_seq1:1556-1795(-)
MPFVRTASAWLVAGLLMLSVVTGGVRNVLGTLQPSGECAGQCRRGRQRGFQLQILRKSARASGPSAGENSSELLQIRRF